MNTENTCYIDPCDPNFPATDLLIAIRYEDETVVSNVYAPTFDAIVWDFGTAEDAPNNLLAKGSRCGGFVYCQIKATGRTLQDVPGISGRTDASRFGLKVKITVGIGTGLEPEDRKVVDGWLLAPLFEGTQDARARLEAAVNGRR